MGKLLDYIAKETQGECFASFKYCYDDVLPPPEYRIRGERGFVYQYERICREHT